MFIFSYKSNKRVILNPRDIRKHKINLSLNELDHIASLMNSIKKNIIIPILNDLIREGTI